MQRKAVWLLAGVLLVSRATTARADTGDAAAREQQAEELFRQSREAAKRGDYLTACAGFRESQNLVATAGTLLNLADCEERAGKLTQALTDFEEVLRELAPTDSRAQLAAVRATGLSARVPRITVTLGAGASTEGVRVTMEPTGQAVAIGSALRLDPGDYRIVLHSAGGERSLPVTLHESESKEVVADAPVVAIAPSPLPVPAPLPLPASGPTHPRSTHRTLGLAVGGAGVALLAVGIGTGIAVAAEAETYKNHCTPGCDAAGASAASAGRALGVVSPVALGLGAVGAGVGAYFLLTSRREPVAVTIHPTAGGGLFSCRMAF